MIKDKNKDRDKSKNTFFHNYHIYRIFYGSTLKFITRTTVEAVFNLFSKNQILIMYF